jgi:hypothetical protein
LRKSANDCSSRYHTLYRSTIERTHDTVCGYPELFELLLASSCPKVTWCSALEKVLFKQRTVVSRPASG